MPDVLCPLIDRFRAALARCSGATALSHADGDVTYGELWDDVLSWRDRLSPFRFRPGSVVAIVSDGSAAMVPVFLGVRAAGLVPFLADALLPWARRAELAAAARPAATVELSNGATISVADGDHRVLPAGAGYVVFSSGSQGPPKGIVGNADGAARFLDWEARMLGLGRSSRVALLASPSFDVVLRDMLLPLVSGGVSCVAGVRVRSVPGAVVPWLRAADVNVVHLVPSLSTRWVAAAPTAGSVPSLRWSLFAGEPLYGRHVARWRSIAPASGVVNLYGPSETTLAKFWHTVATDPGAGIVPVGRPLPGTTVGSGTTGGDPPVGEPFRIMIRTRDGSLGYLPNGNDRHDSLTRQDGVTTFVTNDRGRLDGDGLLVVEGRLDSVAKRNGILVDLADVAARALDDASVAQAYCVQVDEDTSGDLILAIEGTQAFSLPDLSRHLRTTLGSAMPNEIMVFESLPVLPSGKIDRLGVRAAVGTRRSLTAGREKV